MVTQILFFDTPRSASHLLERILSKQSRRELLYTPLSACRGLQVKSLTSEDWASGMSDTTRVEFRTAAQEGVQKWEDALKRTINNDKILYIQDHPFSSADPAITLDLIKSYNPDATPFEARPLNFTSIPSSLLLKPGTIPILTIRHPILTVSSTYRVLDSFGLPNGSGRPNFLITTNPIRLRMLYLFYRQNGIEPIIADADDFMTSREYVEALAEKAGLNKEQLVFEWERPSEEERREIHPMLYMSQKNLMESTGVRSERAGLNMDLEKEREGRKEEFGSEEKKLMDEMVELAMPHCEWLWERRFQPGEC